MAERQYVTLMASLPYHGRLFGARQTPLSRFQLNKRLAWLHPDDAGMLDRIEEVVRWRRLMLMETDENFIGRARAVIDGLESPLLAKIVRRRMETRTLIAALRMRSLHQAPPAATRSWGIGRWVDVMRRYWNEPDFGLIHQYPWVIDADEKIRARDALGLERLFMEHAWRQLSRYGAGHYFDFEAVAIYVLRWDLIDRWTRYDADTATTRILELAEAGLGDATTRVH